LTRLGANIATPGSNIGPVPHNKMQGRKTMKKFPLSLIVVVFLVTACASKAKPTATPLPPTETPVPPTPTPYLQLPDGAYATNVTLDELVATGMTELEACENAGKFVLTVAGARWSVVQSAAAGCTVLNPNMSGAWQYAGNKVTFHDDAPFGCNADYTYTWNFDGATLRFTSVDDTDCVGRVFYMTKHAWLRQK
jgi:hypothetical protein